MTQTLTEYHQVLKNLIRVNQELTRLESEKNSLLRAIQTQTPTCTTTPRVDPDSTLPPLSKILEANQPRPHTQQTRGDFLAWLKQNFPAPGTFTYRQAKQFFHGKDHTTLRRALTALTASGAIKPVIPGGTTVFHLT